MTLRLHVLPGRYAVCRLEPDAPVPPAPAPGPLWSVTRTAGELSVVCAEADAPPGARCEPGWTCLALEGPIPFAATGVLASVLEPLAAAGVSIFAMSTFDTDAVMVPRGSLQVAIAALSAAGHRVDRPDLDLSQ
jgi:uncharacterized protein